MLDDAFTIVQACAAGLIVTAVTGGFYLSTWSEVGLLFMLVSAISYFTIKWADGR